MALELVIRGVSLMVAALSVLVPGRPGKISFFSYPDFSDNAYALYRHLAGTPGAERLEYVWFCFRDERARAALRADPELARLAGVTKIVRIKSPRHFLSGVYHFLTSGHVFHTHGLFWYAAVKRGRVIVNLWHGMALKKLEKLENPGKASVPGRYTIATSPFFRDVMASVFGMKPDDVLVTGLPRVDLFGNRADAVMNYLTAGDPSPDTRYGRIVAWMPTYRRSSSVVASDYPLVTEVLLRELNGRCRARDVLCLVKLHPMEALNRTMGGLAFSHVRVVRSDDLAAAGIDIYELLGAVDRIVTDYSSIFVDFAVLGRPMAFYVPDEGMYGPGFIPAVKDVVGYPGRVLRTTEALFDFIVADDDAAPPSPEARRLMNDYPRDRTACDNVIRAVGLDAVLRDRGGF